MYNNDDLKIALLIDAENISEKFIGAILDELSSKYGKVTYRRIYGDWTSTSLSKWKDSAVTLALTPMQQFGYVKNKNSTDSAMIIDAMDILYTSDVTAFCLVSSDSDFTRLAARLREAGKFVLGMGEGKTPAVFRNACSQFITLDNLTSKAISEMTPIPDEAPLQKISLAEKAILTKVKAIAITHCDDDGWTKLADVGNILAKQVPDFDTRDYGARSLSLFIRKYDWLIETKTMEYDTGVIHYFIKFKASLV